MKIKYIKTQNYKLFKYKLLKLQIYSRQPLFNFSNVALEQGEIYAKQVLKIIFEYHIQHLKILFIGFPIVSKIKQTKLIHFTNHNFIPEESWINGFFRNRFAILHYLKLLQSRNFSKKLQHLLAIKAKPNLVVVCNQELEIDAVNEFYKLGIPVLSFNYNSLINSKITYKILGNFNIHKKNIRITLFSLLYSLLKKTHYKKK